MKRAVIILIIVTILLTACSVKSDSGLNESSTETSKAEMTTAKTTSSSEKTTAKTDTTSAKTTTSRLASAASVETSSQRIPQEEFVGDRTIRTGTKLDTAEFDKIGPLIGGKIMTFKNIGESYLKTPYINPENGSDVNLSFCEQEIGYINCKTGEKVSLCKIKPMTNDIAAIGLDSTYVYVGYTKYPQEKIADSLNEEEYSKAVNNNPYTILQINIKNNEVKEFTVYTFGERTNVYELLPIGTDSLLIHYYTDTTKYLGTESSRDNFDTLDLQTGKLSNFYNIGIVYGTVPLGFEGLTYVNTTEDRIFFQTSQKTDSEWIFGFKVYDTKMNLLNSVEVYRSSNLFLADMFVYNGIVYFKVHDDMSGHILHPSESKYFKLVPEDGNYKPVQYNFMKTPFYINVNKNPRITVNVPYDIFQSVDENGMSFLNVRDTFEPYDHEMKIAIDRFVSPTFRISRNYITCDYLGDFLVYSGDTGKSGFGYYYIPKEEIMRAIYGK